MKAKKNRGGVTPRQYDEEFKREALRLWQESGKSARVVAEELGMPMGNLFKWKVDFHGLPPPGVAPRKRTIEELEAEVVRLRRENAELTDQREILKKAAGILSTPSRGGMPGSKP
jgi:transposase